MKSSRRTSITDIAKALNLSASTVSRALRDHAEVSEPTKVRVRELAAQLQYQPNQLAAALRIGRSHTLGVLVPHITGHFFPEVVNGIATEASRAGYNVMICQSNEDERQEKKNIDLLMNAQVEGIMVSLANSTQAFEHFESVQQAGVPLVFFDRVVEGLAGRRVSAVVFDDRAGAYQAVSHLIEQGCRRIAHFTGPLHLNIHRNRHQGYLDALHDHGLTVDENLLYVADLQLEAGADGMRQMLELPQPPDAVFASNDLAAAGALQLLKQRHIRVPEEIALAGFSNELFSILTEPTLTTVDQRCHQMGQTAVRQLLKMLPEDGIPVEAPAPIMLSPKLLVRHSSQRNSGEKSAE
jgi:LacI family transcriptional regulator